jgi:acetyl esterase/lipase
MAARWGVRPVLALPLPWRVLRRTIELATPPVRLRSPCAEAWEEVAGLPCLTVTPPRPRGTVLWLHGGGFVIGSPRSYRRLAHRLARRSRARIVLPRYRLAPEHPFPAALEDAVAAAIETASRGPFWLGGDSAGGNLALGACAELLARGLRPRGLVLASPAPDLDVARDLPEDCDEMLLPLGMLRRVVADYLGNADPTDPRASPLRAAFPDPPPTLIQCAAGEVLEPDIDALAAHLRAQGGLVRVEKARGLPHDYQLLAGFAPAADRAVDRMAAFLRATR